MGNYSPMQKGRYGDHKGTIGQRERMKDARKDAYVERQKWPEPTKCARCGAVYTDGRWTWNASTAGAHKVTCPACRRIEDNYPAGIFEIRGAFLAPHRKEIVNLLRNVEAAEEAEHPLERIMTIQEDEDGMTVTTTGLHLARRLAESLERAYNGILTWHYMEDEQRVRVRWER